jgi:hypothetical protein
MKSSGGASSSYRSSTFRAPQAASSSRLTASSSPSPASTRRWRAAAPRGRACPVQPSRARSCAAQVKVYELSQLALKFERHMLSEVRCARPAPRPASARLVYSLSAACGCADYRLSDPVGGLLQDGVRVRRPQPRLPRALRRLPHHAAAQDAALRHVPRAQRGRHRRRLVERRVPARRTAAASLRLFSG